jgi:hypothetical protein
MDVSKIGSSIRESTFEQPFDFNPVAYVAQFVDTHIVDIVRSDRDQPMPHDLRHCIHPRETLAGVGVKKNRSASNRPREACQNDKTRAT